MNGLSGKHVLLGMTGGIAAYKVCELARRIQDEAGTVQVVMTPSAERFVTATTMQTLTGRPVFTSAWDQRIDNAMPHIELSRHANVLLVAPASAHFIARLAGGLADDLLSTLALARPRERCPLLLAPAMNVEMWEHPATQRNVRQVRDDGAAFLGPASGDQACGETGAGRMLEPHELLEDLIAALRPKVLRERRVLITAGPTYEPIDPVRGITNRSSGRTGYALARAAREAGAIVTLISGPTELATPRGVHRIDVTTAGQMYEQVLGRVGAAEVFIAVAAVADWHVVNASAAKLKKAPGSAPPTLQMARNPDILATVAARPDAPFCVGFAAESDDVLHHAREKRRAKNVPLLIANRAQDALGTVHSEMHLIDANGVVTLPRDDKLAQARRIVAEIAIRLG